MQNKIHSGELYLAGDTELLAVQRQHLMNMHLFNQTAPDELAKREELLRHMLAEVGEGCYIEPPFRAN